MHNSNVKIADEIGYDQTILNDQNARKSLSASALKAFIRMADEWSLSVSSKCILLGGIPKQTYYKWARGDVSSLSRDVLERIGIILGIYKGLKLLFVDKTGQLNWFNAKNQDYAFKGISPIERMSKGSILDLYAVRNYIDALRGA